MTTTAPRTRRHHLRALGVAVLAAAALSGVVGCGESSGDQGTSTGVVAVEPRQADTSLKALGLEKGDPDVVLLDVRTPAEFAEGHLAGAVNLDLNGPGFADAVAALDKDKSYFVYCHTGNRSATAAQLMHDAGLSKVYDIQGGISAWSQEGLPVTR
jgi:rhodanese-related sulfurtransferase